MSTINTHNLWVWFKVGKTSDPQQRWEMHARINLWMPLIDETMPYTTPGTFAFDVCSISTHSLSKHLKLIDLIQHTDAVMTLPIQIIFFTVVGPQRSKIMYDWTCESFHKLTSFPHWVYSNCIFKKHLAMLSRFAWLLIYIFLFWCIFSFCHDSLRLNQNIYVHVGLY